MRRLSDRKVPTLPAGWHAQSAVIPSVGTGRAGDFLSADVREDRLELVLVDVCGNGPAAWPQAMRVAAELDSRIGRYEPADLLEALNGFLLAQGTEEAFTTAVHIRICLLRGAYTITSAGHPPALRWVQGDAAWTVDNARGTALGVIERPHLGTSTGVLQPGEALMFYTDGVIESRGSDLDEGIAWLQRVGAQAVAEGFGGAAGRIVKLVERGDDDRAVLILWRQ